MPHIAIQGRRPFGKNNIFVSTSRFVIKRASIHFYLTTMQVLFSVPLCCPRYSVLSPILWVADPDLSTLYAIAKPLYDVPNGASPASERFYDSPPQTVDCMKQKIASPWTGRTSKKKKGVWQTAKSMIRKRRRTRVSCVMHEPSGGGYRAVCRVKWQVLRLSLHQGHSQCRIGTSPVSLFETSFGSIDFILLIVRVILCSFFLGGRN